MAETTETEVLDPHDDNQRIARGVLTTRRHSVGISRLEIRDVREAEYQRPSL